VRDEVGNWWTASGVTVGEFGAEMTSASLTGITLSFDSLPQHDYNIQWVPSLGSPWQTVETVTASGAKSSVVVPYPGSTNSTGFFRVQLK
jgi:hypothetical protein